MTKQTKAKRNIFAELLEGVDAMAEQRKGKATLRSHALPVADPAGKLVKRLARTRKDSRAKTPFL
jgi:hypothetical protein